LGPIEIKMSGCMNACGHHHVGHIGILGVDKHGKEWYQITVGGSPAGPASLGEVLGPSVAKDRVADTIGKLLEVYVRERDGEDEQFLQTVRRIGVEPFRERVYETDHSPA
jgi:sulfite reductase (NADPH) hemoprotein beta-component